MLKSQIQPWVTKVEQDLLTRTQESPDLLTPFKDRHTEAKSSGRTADTFSQWFEAERTQIAVAWVLAAVFVRFLEDNELLDSPHLSGPGPRLRLADEAQQLYFQQHPHDTDRDYLLSVFTEMSTLPGLGSFFRKDQNPLWLLGPSGPLCGEFITFWRRQDEESGDLLLDFTDPTWDTRFLGDLYQDLSEAARKRFALLQTPDFVEKFILDHTLTPALDTFGLEETRLIDPTCGSGHFLLGAFARLFPLHQQADPGANPRVLAQRALAAIHGVDLNPFAVSIARFRLLIAALHAAGEKKLKAAPDFHLHLAVGDSLLHGRRFRQFEGEGREQFFNSDDAAFHDEHKHFYQVEDRQALHHILGQQYHAVVGNPPYITVKDKALNQLYRGRYDACHRQYSLSVPFMERFFDLTLNSENDDQSGFCGQITANSFMKREFGKKLITEHIPRLNLTHVIDTSGAYIPGHGTPTVILFGRNRKPGSRPVRAVLGIKGEPATPDIPAEGKVWSSILTAISQNDFENEFISSSNSKSEIFARHPWNLQGGRAAQTKDAIEGKSQELEAIIDVVGRTTHTGEDGAFLLSRNEVKRLFDTEFHRELIVGTLVRDYTLGLSDAEQCLFPYEDIQCDALDELPANLLKAFWPNRRLLKNRKDFGNFIEDRGLHWWEHSMFFPARYRIPLSITFAFVATHNHFVLDRGGKVFNRSAPVIKLPEGAGEEDHLRLLGPLNSSTACFWMQQVFHNKGGPGGGSSKDEKWKDFYEHDGTKLKKFPLPATTPLALATRLDAVAQDLARWDPQTLAERGELSKEGLAAAEGEAAHLRRQLISLQEELDWACYRHYGLSAAPDLEWPEAELDRLPPIGLGERAFEIAMARQIEAGELETKWFSTFVDSGSRPITELPAHWPAAYRDLVQCRLDAIAQNPDLNLIERPNYKRRWEIEPWASRQEEALRHWLLTRLETYFHGGERMRPASGDDGFTPQSFPAATQPALVSLQTLADAASGDARFIELATLYAGEGVSISSLVIKLCTPECVPYLPSQRYKAPGLRKRQDWEDIWAAQRKEDAVEARIRQENPDAPEESLKPLIRAAQQAEVGPLSVPPKYKSTDFSHANYWKLRGKLDVPKERWISYPGLEGGTDGDDTLVIAWAGWDHAQQAKALAEAFLHHQQNSGWPAEKLAPMLAGLTDLLPRLHQWHPGVDPAIGLSLPDFIEGFIDDQARSLGLTAGDLRSQI